MVGVSLIFQRIFAIVKNIYIFILKMFRKFFDKIIAIILVDG